MRPAGLPARRVGLIFLLVVGLGTYLGFTKRNPFASPYEVRAVFADSNLLKPRSPVRIAGVEVGKVIRVGRYRDTSLSLVTMELSDEGRPIHRDATLKVRPRLFLEGNFYVDMTPGTPGARELEDGGTLPVAQTSAPVQLDNVLTELDSGVRGSLQQVLQGFGDALDTAPTAAQRRTLPSPVRGLTGGRALNRTLRTSPRALRDTAIVAESRRGPRPGDLGRTIDGFARAAAALDRDDQALGALVGDYAATLRTTAQRSADIRATVRRLAPTARAASTALIAVDGALPGTRRAARELAAAMDEVPATVRAARPWLREIAAFLADDELGGLLDDLRPTIRSTAQAVAGSNRLLPRTSDFSRCVTDVLLPTGDVVVDDGPLSSGTENYKELWHAMVGQASEGQVFDGNGSLLRLQAVGGTNRITSGVTNLVSPGDGPLFANSAIRPTRTSPAFPNRLPPVREDVPCHTQDVPDVNGPSASGPADGERAGAAQPKAPPVLGGG